MRASERPHASPLAGERVPALAVRGITKRYGDVTACDHIDLDLRAGEIHGILGENGAGKSTLMKVLIGLVAADEGRIEIDGTPVAIDSPQRAAALGIGMVHQHFSLVDELRVWENVELGEQGSLDRRRARHLVADIATRHGLEIDPDAVVADLTAGQRQRVEIVKCLRRDPQIVILDEPTSVLTPQESEQLFDVLRVAVRDEGKAVALVSHKLGEVLSATDVVSILHRGRVVDTMATVDADAQRLAQAMVGRPVSLRREGAALGLSSDDNAAGTVERQVQQRPDGAALRVDRAVVTTGGRRRLDELTFEVGRGEIVGIAGIEGNGQAELGDLLSSLVELDDGTVTVDGATVPAGRAGAMAAAGIAVIPENRHDSGCVLELSVAENLFLHELADGAPFGRHDRAVLNRRAAALIDRYGIQCRGPDALLSSLSGGNQQRVVIARELESAPRVLIAAQPTRGLDVGAIEFVTEQLRVAAAAGIGVVLISNELEEIIELADRIIVIHRGSIRGEMAGAAAGPIDVERLGLLMGGADA